tara:strand:+ start:1835 stop:2251 length:417 start_codon:yes stop_codon:yes gene_type:complete
MNSSTESNKKISSKPFSSNTAVEKEDLQMEVELYKGKLEEQWEGLKSNATGYGKQALVIGGIVATTYVVMNAVLPKAKTKAPKKVVAAPEKSQFIKKGTQDVVKAIQSIGWTLAVGWARKKLMNYIADDQISNEKYKQ